MGAQSWSPVALSASLEAGTSTAVTLEGRELVLWRDSSGAAHVWEDRCPHRGMRMSLGFVRGDHIACLYHGWQYDTAGQCRLIPAHPGLEVPKTIRVASFAVAEWRGMVWTAPDDGTAALPEGAAPATAVRSLYIDAPAATVIAALGLAPVPGVPAALYTVSCGGLTLAAGLQQMGAEKTALHLVLDGPAVQADALVLLAKQAVALRTLAEKAAAEAA